jgi:hypothetical protein
LIIISATPFNKPEHPLNMLKLVGVVSHHRMFTFHKESSFLELQGAQQLVEYCKRFDPEGTSRVLTENPWTKKNIDDVCYLLYIKVLQKYITSSMPRPTKPFNKYVFNGYYHMRPEDQKAYIAAIKSLHSSLRYNKETGGVNLKNMNLGAVTKACMALDKSKTYALIRIIIGALENNPSCKVVVAVNFMFSIRALEKNLAKYNPIIFTGSVSDRDRELYISQFQEYNLNRRLFISTLRTGSVSVSLDDTSEGGRFPRVCFGLPSYMVMDIQQWTGRVFRYATTSRPDISLVYGLVDDNTLAKEADLTTAFVRETSVTKALYRAGTVFEETLEGQVADGAVFPNKYPSVLEKKEDVKDVYYIEIQEDLKEEDEDIKIHANNILINEGKMEINPFSERFDGEDDE